MDIASLREDPKEMIPEVIGQMAAWIRANCATYSPLTYTRICDTCGEDKRLNEELRHHPECDVQVLLDLAKAVTD